MKSLVDEQALWSIKRILDLSLHVLQWRPAELSAQVIGRLKPDYGPTLGRLVRTAAGVTGPRIEPLSHCLAPPEGNLIRTLSAHEAGVGVVAISPDGQWAVTAPAPSDPVVRWRLGTRMPSSIMHPEADTPTFVEVSLSKWDLANGKKLMDFEGHRDDVNALAITPDARHVISAGGRRRAALKWMQSSMGAQRDSRDSAVRIWDFATGQLIHELNAHDGAVTSLAVSPSGDAVFTASDDGTVRKWDVATGDQLMCFEEHRGGVRWMQLVSVRIADQSGLVLEVPSVFSASESELLIWVADMGDVVERISLSALWDRPLAVSSDGSKLVIERESVSGFTPFSLDIRELSGGDVRALPDRKVPVSSLTLSGDGTMALIADCDQTDIDVVDIETLQPIVTLSGHSGDVLALVLTPDARKAVSGSLDGTLKVWDLTTVGPKSQVVGHEDDVNAIAVAAGASLAVSCSYDRTVMVWDLPSVSAVASLTGHTRSVTSVDVSADGRTAASGSLDGSVRVWTLPGTMGPVVLDHGDEVQAVAISQTGSFVLSGGKDGYVRAWRSEAGAPVWSVSTGEEVTRSIHVGKGDALVAVGDEAGTVTLLRLVDGRIEHRLLGHHQAVMAVRFVSPTMLASADYSGKILLWDLRSHAVIDEYESGGAAVWGVAVSPDGSFLAAGCDDHVIRVCTTAPLDQIATFTAEEPVFAIGWARENLILAGSAGTGRVYPLRMRTGR